MTNAYIVTGTLTDPKTVHLDEALPVAAGKVRLVIEPAAAPPPQQSLEEYLADLRKRQAARGHVPMTVEEVENYIKAERDSWGD
jgi:hypothetical protein